MLLNSQGKHGFTKLCPEYREMTLEGWDCSGAQLEVTLGWRAACCAQEGRLCHPASCVHHHSSLLPSAALASAGHPAKPNDLNWNFRQLFTPFPPSGVSFLLFYWVKSAQEGPELVREMHRWVATGRHGDAVCGVRGGYAPWFFAPAFQI